MSESQIDTRLRALRVVRGTPKIDPEGETYDQVETGCGVRLLHPMGEGVVIEPEEDFPDDWVRVTLTAWVHKSCITDYSEEA